MNWKKLYKNAFTPWAIILGGAFVMSYMFRGPGGRYIVIKKEDNKILYYPISNPNFLYAMTFGNDTASTGFYNYINIGDTITGVAWHLNNLSPEFPNADCAIKTVNGKTLAELQENARRDSLINNMNTKHK